MFIFPPELFVQSGPWRVKAQTLGRGHSVTSHSICSTPSQTFTSGIRHHVRRVSYSGPGGAMFIRSVPHPR